MIGLLFTTIVMLKKWTLKIQNIVIKENFHQDLTPFSPCDTYSKYP
jgi:hypothetical protein